MSYDDTETRGDRVPAELVGGLYGCQLTVTVDAVTMTTCKASSITGNTETCTHSSSSSSSSSLIGRLTIVDGFYRCPKPRVGPGDPSSPLSIYFLIFSPFYFFLSFLGFTYFLLLSIPSFSTRIVPLCFQAGGRRRRPNLGLVCILFCALCYLYSLVKMYCGALFYLV